MAGEVHPVPFRTRKLSPLAPMVLRSSPWESRTSLTNEGHLRALRAPSPAWWRGPLAYGWARGPRPPAGGASPSGAPAIVSPGVGLGPVGPPSDAPRRVGRAVAPRHPARWRGVLVFLGTCVTPPSASAPGHSARRGGRRRRRGPLFGTGGRLSRGAPRLTWNRASRLPTARDQASNGGATHDAGPLRRCD